MAQKRKERWSPTLGQELLFATVGVPIVTAAYGWFVDDGIAETVHRAFMLWLIFCTLAYLKHWGWCPSSGWLAIPVQIVWFLALMVLYIAVESVIKYLLAWP